MSCEPLGLGPTFIPGGFDDFCIPQKNVHLTSPAPKRVLQEVPENMHGSLAAPSLNYDNSWDDTLQMSASHSLSMKQRLSADQLDEQSILQTVGSFIGEKSEGRDYFSYFPNLRKRTSNVPPSPEERLRVLDAARLQVLRSPDPEMQLSWAQDALIYSEVCIEEKHRSDSQYAKITAMNIVTGKIEQQIQTDAMNIVMYLADQRHPKADFLKGMWLEFGKFGFAEDRTEAFRCYKRSAMKGFSRAEYRLGMQYEFTGENMKALQHYKNGEAQRDAASCYRLGMMSLLGQLGQAQDFQNAIRLIKQAADSADENAPQAAYVYGMLQAGELPQITIPEVLLPQDLSSALHYIEKAAYLGFSKAQLKMGSAYELCTLGCDFDPILSIHYNHLASRQGEEEAEMSLSKWFLCGYEGLFQKNDELAFLYAQRASTTGLATAQFAIGYFYEVGVHVGRDLSHAQIWYEQAARNGNNDAIGRIAGLSKSRTLTKMDHENATLSRIRSRHGSRRGYRSEQAHKPLTPMPKIPDEYTQGSRKSRTDASGIPLGNVIMTAPIPSKSKFVSCTPYPVDDTRLYSNPYVIEDLASLIGWPDGPTGGILKPDLDKKLFSTMIGGHQGVSATRYQEVPCPIGPVTQLPNLNVRSSHEGSTTGHLSPRMDSASRNATNRIEPDDEISNDAFSSVEKLDIGFIAPIDPRAERLNRVGPTDGTGRHKTGSKIPNGERLKSQAKLQRKSTAKLSNPGTHQPVSCTSISRKRADFDSVGAALPRFSLQSTKPFVPTKGPQTFEEMGVPAGKDEHDCAVM